ncbi:MAG: recombination mediator RecR [Candidatus Babeliales bacterium]
MIDQSPTFKQLVRQFQQVPYLASKNMYRVIAHFLTIEQAKAQEFCQAIMQAKEQIVRCPICCTWKEKETSCFFCQSPTRDQAVICVVETWQELLAIEKTEGFKGVYHVLGGALSPLEGISPYDLSIDQLIKRIEAGKVKELILATNQTPEGEATAAFIAQQLKSFPVTITCLARGVPVGSSLEYMDRVTVLKAISERRNF